MQIAIAFDLCVFFVYEFDSINRIQPYSSMATMKTAITPPMSTVHTRYLFFEIVAVIYGYFISISSLSNRGGLFLFGADIHFSLCSAILK